MIIMDLKHTIMEQGKSRNKHCLWLILILIVVFQGCARLFGIYPITKNVYLWDAGTPKEKVIIFNSEDKAWNIVSGISIIPSDAEFQKEAYNNTYEYVEEYSYDGEWLLAETTQLTDSFTNTRYWIVHIPDNEEHELDKIIKSTIGPLTRTEYDNIIASKNISRSL